MCLSLSIVLCLIKNLETLRHLPALLQSSSFFVIPISSGHSTLRNLLIFLFQLLLHSNLFLFWLMHETVFWLQHAENWKLENGPMGRRWSVDLFGTRNYVLQFSSFFYDLFRDFLSFLRFVFHHLRTDLFMFLTQLKQIRDIKMLGRKGSKITVRIRSEDQNKNNEIPSCSA